LRVLLTGGLGYLGGRLAGFLAEHTGYEVVLGTRTPERVPKWAAEYRIVRTAWADQEVLVSACSGVEAVVHLAGMNARGCNQDPIGALELNAVGTARLLSAARRAQVRRFIHLSSAHVYGGALVGTVDESTCPAPRHPYATSHRAGEDVVREAQRARRIEGLVVRLSNSYGAPADPAADCWTLLTNDLCLQAVRSRRLVLATTGEQRRDFMPLGDVCRALAHLLTVPAAVFDDEVINVGGGWAPTLREMAARVAARVEAVLGFHPQVHLGERSDAVGSGLIEYRIGRLLASGFAPGQNAVMAELDGLIRFCDARRESLP
jgi:UDP-glucose 4-epimerase